MRSRKIASMSLPWCKGHLRRSPSRIRLSQPAMSLPRRGLKFPGLKRRWIKIRRPSSGAREGGKDPTVPLSSLSLSLSPRPRRCGKGFEGEWRPSPLSLFLSLSPLSPFSKEGRDGDGGAEVGGGWDGWKSNSAHAGAAHLTLPAQRSLPLFSPSFPLPNLPTPSSVQFTKSLDLFLGQMECHLPNTYETQEHGVVTPWFVLC